VQAGLALTIRALAATPGPPGSLQVVGQTNTWRVRAGAYRVIYEVYDDRQLVVVFLAERRSEGTYRF
jgi:mRNA interferase RelE/StbE